MNDFATQAAVGSEALATALVMETVLVAMKEGQAITEAKDVITIIIIAVEGTEDMKEDQG